MTIDEWTLVIYKIEEFLKIWRETPSSFAPERLVSYMACLKYTLCIMSPKKGISVGWHNCQINRLGLYDIISHQFKSHKAAFNNQSSPLSPDLNQGWKDKPTSWLIYNYLHQPSCKPWTCVYQPTPKIPHLDEGMNRICPAWDPITWIYQRNGRSDLKFSKLIQV